MIIELQNVTKAFVQRDQQTDVLKGISVLFKGGHSYALQGVSGSGKSTLLSIITGLDSPTTGTVLIDGVDTNSWTNKQRETFFRDTIGIIFQYPYLIRELNVLENVAIKALINNTPDAYLKAEQLLEKVGLADKKNQMPLTLSGGEQQRVACARALIHNPAFIIADEPTAHLDAENREIIINLLEHEQKQSGRGLLVTTHDASVAQRMQHIIKIHNGILQ